MIEFDKVWNGYGVGDSASLDDMEHALVASGTAHSLDDVNANDSVESTGDAFGLDRRRFVLMIANGSLASVLPFRAGAAMVSPAVLPAGVKTLNDLGYVGINLESHSDWHMDRYYIDVMKGSRGFNTPTDSHGWPTASWQVVLSTKNGNCPPGVYKGRYLGSSGQVSASAGVTIRETSDADGYVTFSMIVPSYVPGNGNMIIQGAAGVKNLEIMRPGFQPGARQFWNPASLNYLKFANSIRYMKPLAVECGAWSPNGAELQGGVWATRNTPTNCRSGFSRVGMPHEWVIDQANTLRPLGNLKSIWINFFHTATDDYVTQCAALYKNKLDPDLVVYFEYANENWNSSYTSIFNYMLMQAVADVDGAYAKVTGGGYKNRFVSIMGDGNNVKVVFTNAHHRKTGDRITAEFGANFSITNGVCGVIDTNTLSFPATGVGSVSPSNGALYIGTPNTGVSYDGSTNINLLLRRFQLKRVREIGLLIESVFGSSVSGRARMITGQQQADAGLNYGFGEATYKYAEDVFPARKLATIVYACALHPYPDQTLPNTATSVQDYKDLLDVSIARNAMEIKRFMNLNVCHGLKTIAYEWGPAFLNNGVPGHTAVQQALQKDDRMRQVTESAWQAYANCGMELQQFFHYTPSSDWDSPNPADPDGTMNWYSNGDPNILAHTPKTRAVNNALSIVPLVNDALNLVGPGVSTLLATNHGRVDRYVPGNNLGWTFASKGAGGDGNVGYDRAGSTAAIGPVARWIEFGVLIMAAGSYGVNVWARISNNAGTPENVILTLDDAALAVCPLSGAVGGNFINNATSASTKEVPVTLPSGFHRLRLSVPAGAQGSAAVRKIVFTKLA